MGCSACNLSKKYFVVLRPPLLIHVDFSSAVIKIKHLYNRTNNFLLLYSKGSERGVISRSTPSTEWLQIV